MTTPENTEPPAFRRQQPESMAKRLRFPDPMQYDILTCPYCIDAREQIGSGLAGCLRHA